MVPLMTLSALFIPSGILRLRSRFRAKGSTRVVTMSGARLTILNGSGVILSAPAQLVLTTVCSGVLGRIVFVGILSPLKVVLLSLTVTRSK